jgi:hypothetical protein
MNFSVFNNKKIIDGVVRMTRPSILFMDIDSTNYTEHIVGIDEVGRVDIIAHREYSGDWYGDIILKFNNISNPFSFKAGDVLRIPSREANMKIWKDIDDSIVNENPIRSQFIDSKRLTTKDKKRIKYLEDKASNKANGSRQILPPNILKHGQDNVIKSKGKISLSGGHNVSKSKTSLSGDKNKSVKDKSIGQNVVKSKKTKR